MSLATYKKQVRILEAKLKRSQESRSILEDIQEARDQMVQAHIIEMAAVQADLVRRHTELQTVHQQLLDSERRAKNANEAKSQFLASMSHELRTPLNAIIGYAELLEEEITLGEMTNQEIAADLTRIRTSGRHLLSLVNDILDLSKIEAGEYPLDMRSVDVRQLIESVVVNVLPGIEKNGNCLTIELDEVGDIVTDPMAFSQCVINLLSNAGKFTHDGSVSLRLTRLVSGIRVDVEDTGIGMTPEQTKAVFSAFVQADVSTSRRYGGTGLGLSISRHLIGLLGGKVSVVSIPGVGSTFTVEIPDQIDQPATSLPVTNHLQESTKHARYELPST